MHVIVAVSLLCSVIFFESASCVRMLWNIWFWRNVLFLLCFLLYFRFLVSSFSLVSVLYRFYIPHVLCFYIRWRILSSSLTFILSCFISPVCLIPRFWIFFQLFLHIWLFLPFIFLSFCVFCFWTQWVFLLLLSFRCLQLCLTRNTKRSFSASQTHFSTALNSLCIKNPFKLIGPHSILLSTNTKFLV